VFIAGLFKEEHLAKSNQVLITKETKKNCDCRPTIAKNCFVLLCGLELTLSDVPS
jgi:hypothetical protein